jgi:hypothetical protein
MSEPKKEFVPKCKHCLNEKDVHHPETLACPSGDLSAKKFSIIRTYEPKEDKRKSIYE